MIPLIVIGVVLAIGFAVLAAYLQAPSVRGKRGEKRVRTVLGETQEGLRYVFNDFKITDEGMSCQIDHILINQNGVFVIETKNYSGNIYGTDEQREWTQVLAYGKVKNKIYNPVKQHAFISTEKNSSQRISSYFHCRICSKQHAAYQF